MNNAVPSPSSCRIGRHDDFPNTVLSDAPLQGVDRKLFRSNAFQRRYPALQHVIHPLKGPRRFQRNQVARLLDDADDLRVAPRVRTDMTNLPFGQVVATGAQGRTVVLTVRMASARLQGLLRPGTSE